jgi:hypothetical protein
MLELSLTRSGQAKLNQRAKLEKSGTNWALVLDDRVVALAPIERRPNPARLRLNVSGTRLLAKHIAILAQAAPVRAIYRLNSLERLD